MVPHMSPALKPPDRMTVTEFLAWDAPGETRWQLFDGEPGAMAPGSRTHGTLQLELGGSDPQPSGRRSQPLHGHY